MRFNEVERLFPDCDARADFPRPTPVGELNGLTLGKSGCEGVIAGFLTGGVNRALPAISSATEVWSALTLAVLGGGIAVLSAMIATSIAVTSAKLMLAES